MRDDETAEFIVWQDQIDTDDLLHAFRAIKTVERIRFELTTREEGFVERIADAVER